MVVSGTAVQKGGHIPGSCNCQHGAVLKEMHWRTEMDQAARRASHLEASCANTQEEALAARAERDALRAQASRLQAQVRPRCVSQAEEAPWLPKGAACLIPHHPRQMSGLAQKVLRTRPCLRSRLQARRAHADNDRYVCDQASAAERDRQLLDRQLQEARSLSAAVQAAMETQAAQQEAQLARFKMVTDA